jgi:nitroreductase
MSEAMIEFLLSRRSSRPAMLREPGPDASQLRTMLTAAARVPDHKKLAPWRFLVFAGDARRQFGEKLAEVCQREETETPSEVRLQTERDRFLRAPLVVGVVSRVDRSRGVPEMEQILSAGAAAFNFCLAANALGFGTSWITEWYAFSPGMRPVLGLGEDETMAGFIYVGTAAESQPDRDRPILDDIVTHWAG